MRKIYAFSVFLMALFMSLNVSARTVVKTSADVKFTTLTDNAFPDNAVWYEIKVKTNNRYLYYNESNTVLPSASLLEGKQTAGLWCFVGDSTNFKIYNFKRGASAAMNPSSATDTTYNNIYVSMGDNALSFSMKCDSARFTFNDVVTKAFLHLFMDPQNSQITLLNYPDSAAVSDSCQFQLIELTSDEVVKARKQAIYGAYNTLINVYGGFSESSMAKLKDLCNSDASTFDEISAEEENVKASERISAIVTDVNYRIISNNNTEDGLYSLVDTTGNEMLYWKRTDTGNPRMLFRFEKADADGHYYIKNVTTGMYIGDVFKSVPVKMSETATYMFSFENDVDANKYRVAIKCLNPSNNPDKPYLHGAGMAFGTDEHAVVGWGKWAGPSSWRLQMVSGSYVKITMPEEAYDPAKAYYGTYYNTSGKALSVPNDIKAYALTAYASEKATLEPLKVINDGQAVLVYGLPGSYSLGDTVADKTAPKSILTGVKVETMVPTGYYVYYDQFDENSLLLYSTNFTIPAGGAYLDTSDSANGSFLVFQTGDTGIASVAKDSAKKECYDLQGRRVSNPTKGVYIIGNKKVIK